MDLTFASQTLLALSSGVPLTIGLAGSSLLLGSTLAALLTLLRRSGSVVLEGFARVYVFVFRGTPALVQIFVIYYGFGQFRPLLQDLGVWWIFREPVWCAVFALSLNTAAYSSEIFRGALQSVPPSQIESARAYGMSGFLLYRRVVLPLAIRQALPTYGSEIILIVKSTSLASVITMMEVTGIAAKLISQTYRATEIFIAAGLIYLLINFLITQVIAALERWLSPEARRKSPLALLSEAANA